MRYNHARLDHHTCTANPRDPRTLFATHCEIVFVRHVIPGAADGSYGIQAARLAGLPLSVIDRAKTTHHANVSRLDGRPARMRLISVTIRRFAGFALSA